MRPFETLLIIANILAFIVLAFPLPQAFQWARYLAPISLLFAALQAVFEGPRLEIVPAYVMAGLFLVIWLAQNANPEGIFTGHRWISRVGIGLGILGLVLSTFLPIAIPVFRFPQPTGNYGIGTLTYHWIDDNRPEIFTADQTDHRELVVQIWYPAQESLDAMKAPYLPEAEIIAAEFTRVQNKPQFKNFLGNLTHIKTNAVPSAPVADRKAAYPVLIFQEGATGFRQMNTYQVEELVSQGYIVAAIDQPYTAVAVVFPNGRLAPGWTVTDIKPLIRQSYLPYEEAPALNGQVLENGILPYLTADTSFTLDQLAAVNESDPNGILTGRLDLERTGIFGFSLGGIVAGDVCRQDARVKACIIMDAPMTTATVKAGLDKPVMWLTRDADTMRLERERAGGWPEEEISAHLDSMRAVYNDLPADGYFVQIPKIFHSNYCDIPSWSPLFRWLGLSGPFDVNRTHEIINAYSVAFFDRYLKGSTTGLLEGPSAEYPEAIFESRHP